MRKINSSTQEFKSRSGYSGPTNIKRLVGENKNPAEAGSV